MDVSFGGGADSGEFARYTTIWLEQGARDLEDVRSMKTGCLSWRRRRLWWEENIVLLLKSLAQLVGGVWCSPESRGL